MIPTPNLRARSASRAVLLVSILAAAASVPRDARAQAAHPLDGLTAQEYWTVFEALKSSGHVDKESRYTSINLREPPKAEVLKWKPGEAFRREALVVVKHGKQTFEAVVDVARKAVASWTEVQGVQPNITRVEDESVEDKVKENPEWQEAMRKRGITDFETVECSPESPGYFGTPEEQGRRLFRVICWLHRGTWNIDARPISGVVVVWDADDKKVLRVIDTGAVPIPANPQEYFLDSIVPREASTPLRVEQPLGPGFRVHGHEVTWQNWMFHFRVDPRVGLVVSTVRYNDASRPRSILYEGSLSEIFVPYMDPAEGWYHWTYMDAGEYSQESGGFRSSLVPGSDCPDNAVFFDAVFANARGIPVMRPRAACLFERAAGDISWRHLVSDSQIESRSKRELVLRAIGTYGNYDYVFDWVFQEDGAIRVAVGATGIVLIKGVKSRTAMDDRDGRDAAYGRFVAENSVAVNHDHFFCFRLDFDVDGVANSFVREKLTTERLPADHPRKSIWVAHQETAKTEQQARLHINMEKPEVWRVVNPNVKGPLGYAPGYEIRPGHNAMSLLTPDDFPQRRAGFTEYHVWVTPQRDGERYAAGDYVTQSKGGDGLPSWTKADRPIENTDIVVWYTLGFHHLVRAEDWPITPTAWHEFELRPFDFFARNPALDLPKEK
jgi:primary-amine oxidase